MQNIHPSTRLKYLFFIISIMASSTATAQWVTIKTKNPAIPRHENTFVECDGKFYALGGRGTKPVEEFDPLTSSWSVVADAPSEFNHLQAIAFKHEIYVIGALKGSYPHESTIQDFLIFNPATKTWRKGPSIPNDRLRGSVGVFSRGNKIYIVGGIKDGHYDGHVPWFDEYDTKTGKWSQMPDAPRARDHFQAVLINDKVYVAGGRRSYAKVDSVLQLTCPEVDVFDFKKNNWTTLTEPLPTPRGGTSSLAAGPYLIVVNGESIVQQASHNEVEALDTRTGKWTSLPPMTIGRHGTGAIYFQGRIYVAAGSANRGGGPELNDIMFLEWPNKK